MENFNNNQTEHFQELSSFNEHIDNIDWLRKGAPNRRSDGYKDHINLREPTDYQYGSEIYVVRPFEKTPNLNKLCNKQLLINT